MLLPHGPILKVHPALHPSSFCPAPRSCRPTHSATSRFTQTTKPSQEPRNKKSVLAATFLRLAIVPSRLIMDRSAKAQVTCRETSDFCFAGAKESCQSQKSCKSTWIFVLRTGGSTVAERIPRKIGSRQQQRSQYREMGVQGNPSPASQSHPFFKRLASVACLQIQA